MEFEGRATAGVKRSVLAEGWVTVPDTTVLQSLPQTKNGWEVNESGLKGLLKVTVMACVSGTPVAPGAGLVRLMVPFWVSAEVPVVKVEENAVTALPSRSVRLPAGTERAYRVLAASCAECDRVRTYPIRF